MFKQGKIKIQLNFEFDNRDLREKFADTKWYDKLRENTEHPDDEDGMPNTSITIDNFNDLQEILGRMGNSFYEPRLFITSKIEGIECVAEISTWHHKPISTGFEINENIFGASKGAVKAALRKMLDEY